jgi:hypothetical protein
VWTDGFPSHVGSADDQGSVALAQEPVTLAHPSVKRKPVPNGYLIWKFFE